MSADEKEPSTSTDAIDMEDHDEHQAKKKKFFHLPKSIKRLFGRKRTKSKDDDGITAVNIKSVSYSDMLVPSEVGEDDEQQYMSNKAISLSADSVFSQEKPAATATNIHSFKPNTRSMEMLLPNQHPFTSELKQRVRGRRVNGEDEQEDDGLPHSPLTAPTTADVLTEHAFKDKSLIHESEGSLGSMDSSENELDEFFCSKWTAGTSKPPGSRQAANSLDLDAITVETGSSLSSDAARHKINLHRKRIANSSRSRNKALSPQKNSSGGVRVMPQLQEERPSVSKSAMKTTIEKEDRESGVCEVPEVTTSDNENKDDDQQRPLSTDSKDSAISSDHGQKTADVKASHDSPKDTMSSEKCDSKEEVSPAPATSVIRRESSTARDSSKRKTIAAPPSQEAEMTIFGSRKKRSSFHELKPWEEEAKNKESVSGKSSDDDSSSGADKSEFAQMFNRFKRQASQKKGDVHDKSSKVEKEIDKNPQKKLVKKAEEKRQIFNAQIKQQDSKPVSVKDENKPVKVPHDKPVKLQQDASVKQQEKPVKVQDASDKKQDKPIKVQDASDKKQDKPVKVQQDASVNQKDKPIKVQQDASVKHDKPVKVQHDASTKQEDKTKPALESKFSHQVSKPVSESTHSKPSVSSVTKDKPDAKNDSTASKAENLFTPKTERTPFKSGALPIKSSLKAAHEISKPATENKPDVKAGVSNNSASKPQGLSPAAKSKSLSAEKDQSNNLVKTDAKKSPSFKVQMAKDNFTNKAESNKKSSAKNEPVRNASVKVHLQNKAKEEEKSVSSQKATTPAGTLDSVDNKDEVKPRSGSDASHRRESPLPKNRFRSQTLPDASPQSSPGKLKNVKNTESSDKLVTEPVNPVVMRQRDSPQRSQSMKPPSSTQLKKPAQIGGTEGSAPSWVALARRKTKDWEDRDPEKPKPAGGGTNEQKENEMNQQKRDDTAVEEEEEPQEDSTGSDRPDMTSETCSDAAGNRKSRVLSMVKNWQSVGQVSS